ncbi:hypothetical protein BHM03_00032276 [Ensete ventricosum]|nr:hypothetical protein BHM03_00032276 [Ensete ventricosum]
MMGSGSPPRRDDRVAKTALEKLRQKSSLRREHGGASPSLVKIRITKKQWEELMSRADMQGVDVHRVLSRIMGRSRSDLEGRGRQWRPSLRSIPEDAESELNPSLLFLIVKRGRKSHRHWNFRTTTTTVEETANNNNDESYRQQRCGRRKLQRCLSVAKEVAVLSLDNGRSCTRKQQR